MEEREICPECNGGAIDVWLSNRWVMMPCNECGGRGFVDSEEEMKVEILTGKKEIINPADGNTD